MESRSFFWGMTLHPEKRYAQTALEPFHISKACVEPSSLKKGEEDGNLTAVYLESENEEFLLCTLGSSNYNESLDLNFNKGEKICVRAEGGGIVHLTGFLMETPEYEIDDFDEDSSDEEEEEESEEEVQVKSKKVVNGIAKKSTPLAKLVVEAKKKEELTKPEVLMAEIKKAEEMKKKLTASPAGKKKEESDEDEDSSDEDEDDIMIDLEAEEGEAEEEESDDDDDDDDDDEEEDSSSDEEEVIPKKKAPETPKDKTKLNKSPKNTPGQKENTPTETKKPKNSETPVAKKVENATQITPAAKKEKGGNAEKKKVEKTPLKDATKNTGDSAQETPGKTLKKTLKGGLIVEDLKLGGGPESKPGKMASLYYVGKLKSNNKQFDACKEGKPFKFRVGQGEVIKAWDIGISGMKVGGKRRLICPPSLAYGAKGAPPDIPPNATLVFEVELKAVN